LPFINKTYANLAYTVGNCIYKNAAKEKRIIQSDAKVKNKLYVRKESYLDHHAIF